MKQDKNRDIKEKVTEEIRTVQMPTDKKHENIVVQEKEIDVEIDAKKK
jgi:hypothetical protein